jgi:ribosomal protein L37AE/L43A
VQDWKVNQYEEYIETMEDCVEITHYPDDMDIWSCANCDYEDRGSAFNVK